MRSHLASTLTRASAGLTLLLATACESRPPEGTWRKIERPGFTFELPGHPEFKDESMDVGGMSVPLENVNWYRGQEQFGITITDFSSAPAVYEQGATTILENAVTGSVQHCKGTTESDRHLTVNGAPAREIVANITFPAAAQMTARFIWSDKRLIMVSYNRPHTTPASPADARKFIDSFQLTKVDTGTPQ